MNVGTGKLINRVRISFNSLMYHMLRKYKLYMFHYHMCI